MGIVSLADEVGDRELQRMHPQPVGLRARRETEPGPEEQQDVGGLADDLSPRLQERRRERWPAYAAALQEAHDRRDAHAAAGHPGDVDVVGTGRLEREADEDRKSTRLNSSHLG